MMVSPITVTHPEVAAMWDIELNDVSADQITKSSRAKRYWVCSEHVHSFTGTPPQVIKNEIPCGICRGRILLPGFNDLESRCPEMASEWSKKNNTLPSQHFLNSRDNVLWECNEGHEWEESPNSRLKGKRSRGVKECPYCSNARITVGVNDLFSVFPELKSQWSPKNTIDPRNLTKFSHKKSMVGL